MQRDNEPTGITHDIFMASCAINILVYDIQRNDEQALKKCLKLIEEVESEIIKLTKRKYTKKKKSPIDN